MSDHYTYPGTEVLINRRGYIEFGLWKNAERSVVQAHMAELFLHPVHGDFGLAHLRAVHAALVEGFYDWGGQVRDTDTGPGGTGIAHCRPEFIESETSRVFTRLASLDYLRGLEIDEFSEGLAWVWGEMTAIHPFRDVNTRSQFVFFNQLADQAGWVIDWSAIDPHVFAYARTVAIYEDELGMDALLRPALIPAAETEQCDEPPGRTEQTRADFLDMRADRTREEVDAALRGAAPPRATATPEPQIKRGGNQSPLR